MTANQQGIKPRSPRTDKDDVQSPDLATEVMPSSLAGFQIAQKLDLALYSLRARLKIRDFKPYKFPERPLFADIRKAIHLNLDHLESFSSMERTIIRANPTLSVLKDDKLRIRLEKELESLGIRHLPPRPLFSSTALIMEIPGHLILRIVNTEYEPNSFNVPEILQPLYSRPFRGSPLTIEVLPAVYGEDVNIEHVNALVRSLTKKGIFFWDVARSNIRLLDDGTPVIVDRGSCVKYRHRNKSRDPDDPDKETYEQFHRRQLKFAYDVDESQHKPTSMLAGMLQSAFLLEALLGRRSQKAEYDWGKSQRNHCKKFGHQVDETKNVLSKKALHLVDEVIGLNSLAGRCIVKLSEYRSTRAKISNVFTDNDIRDMRYRMGGDSKLVSWIVNVGAYRSDLQDVIERANSLFDADEHGETEWIHFLRDECNSFARRTQRIPRSRELDELPIFF